MRAIREHLRIVIMTRRYTNPRLPYLSWIYQPQTKVTLFSQDGQHFKRLNDNNGVSLQQPSTDKLKTVFLAYL